MLEAEWRVLDGGGGSHLLALVPELTLGAAGAWVWSEAEVGSVPLSPAPCPRRKSTFSSPG